LSTAPPVVVVVLGMHRSGTSLLARLLGLAGVGLGKDASLAPAAEDNPRGFWEHTQLREVNDALLQLFGGSWPNPPSLPANWLQDPRVEPLRARAREILAQDFQDLPVWGFKDPRTSLLADFWRDLLPGRVAWIVAVRNPLEVAASLKRRNGMPAVLAEDLWNEYTRAALAATRADERVILHYDRLLADPAGEIARLIRQLRLPLSQPEAARLEQESSRELRHHQHEPEAVQRADTLRVATKSLYQLLQDGDPGPLPAAAQLPGDRAAFQELRAAYAELLIVHDHLRSAVASRDQIWNQQNADLSASRAECLQLQHDNQLLRRRAEHRMGESLRRLLSPLRKALPRPG
jgi:hypothetical protein